MLQVLIWTSWMHIRRSRCIFRSGFPNPEGLNVYRKCHICVRVRPRRGRIFSLFNFFYKHLMPLASKPSVGNQKECRFSPRCQFGLKKGVGWVPAVGLEQKRVSVYSPLSVWIKKGCRLSSRSWFGMKKYTFSFPADGLNKTNVISTNSCRGVMPNFLPAGRLGFGISLLMRPWNKFRVTSHR